MKKIFYIVLALLLLNMYSGISQPSDREANYAGNRVRFKALMYTNEYAEEAHVTFAHQLVEFYHKLTYGEGWIMDKVTSIENLSWEELSQYSVIICPDGLPGSEKERPLFEYYMDHGGGCVAFHASGYNDRDTA